MRRLTIVVVTIVFAAGMASRATAADDDLRPPIADADQDLSDDYDPWQGFNERMFFFNHDILDRYLLKPVATGWSKVLPDCGKRGLDRAFDNLGMPKRLVNNLLQGRFRGAGRELARFTRRSGSSASSMSPERSSTSKRATPILARRSDSMASVPDPTWCSPRWHLSPFGTASGTASTA